MSESLISNAMQRLHWTHSSICQSEYHFPMFASVVVVVDVLVVVLVVDVVVDVIVVVVVATVVLVVALPLLSPTWHILAGTSSGAGGSYGAGAT